MVESTVEAPPLQQLWLALCDALRASADDVVFGDERVCDPVREGYGLRYLTRLFAASSLLSSEAANPADPRLLRVLTPWLNYAMPNADTDFFGAQLHGDYSYSLRGDRGGNALIVLELFNRPFWDFQNVKQLASIDVDDLEAGSDGAIEITLSRTRSGRNWVELPAGDAWLLVRRVFGDWNEEPGRLTIERVGAEYPPPPPSAADLQHQLEDLITWMQRGPRTFAAAARMHYSVDPSMIMFPPATFAADRDEEIGLADQHYGIGHYSCEEDNAVLLEVTPPRSRYWSVQLVSHFWESVDVGIRQTSINSHQALLDPDGVFRAVISQEDPGVTNWLDASSHPAGLLGMRYYRSDSVPVPSLRPIPLTAVATELATSQTVTPSQRQQALRHRATGMHNRMEGMA